MKDTSSILIYFKSWNFRLPVQVEIVAQMRARPNFETGVTVSGRDWLCERWCFGNRVRKFDRYCVIARDMSVEFLAGIGSTGSDSISVDDERVSLSELAVVERHQIVSLDEGRHTIEVVYSTETEESGSN